MAHSTLKNTNVWDELLKMIFFDGTNLWNHKDGTKFTNQNFDSANA
jgi:hypothetical protein